MKVELLTPEREGEYFEFLQKNSNSLFNASLTFRNFFRTLCPDAIPYYFLAIDDVEFDGSETELCQKIVGVLPSFMLKGPLGPVLNSMPWFGSNPGVITDNPEAMIFLLQAFENTAKWTGCFSSTFITPPNQDQFIYETFFDKEEIFIEQRKGLITSLPRFNNPDIFIKKLLNQVHQKTRNQIVKSMGTCQVYETYSIDDWKFLEETHIANMAAVGALSKKKEFEIIRKNFRQTIDYKLYVAFHNGERVAALLLEYFNETVEYITPAVIEKYRHLCPMHLLIFSAMGDAAQNGMKYWNWGGTKVPGQEGVYRFKKRFGAVESEYKYYTKIYLDLNIDITPKWLLDNYKYFFVMPFSLLRR
jgi:hypothetical protein